MFISEKGGLEKGEQRGFCVQLPNRHLCGEEGRLMLGVCVWKSQDHDSGAEEKHVSNQCKK